MMMRTKPSAYDDGTDDYNDDSDDDNDHKNDSYTAAGGAPGASIRFICSPPPQLPPTLVKINASRRSLYFRFLFPSDSKYQNPLWQLPLALNSLWRLPPPFLLLFSSILIRDSSQSSMLASSSLSITFSFNSN